MDNPLLVATPIVDKGLPPFDRIRPQHAEPAIDAVLAENRAALEATLVRVKALGDGIGWDDLIVPLEEMAERLGRAWGPVTHLFAVTSTAEWRAAHNACLPKVTQYQVELSQHEELHRAYQALAASPAYATFSPARRKVVSDALRDFRLSGIGLEAGPRARYREIALRLSELQSKFQENVIDSVQAWSKHVKDESQLAGMTAQGKEAARTKARAKNLEGFRLTLDFPSYEAVISYADDRALRREVYEAYATRASDQGPIAGRFDNGPLIEEILALRHEEAHLLGFRNYAEVSLATKMASSTGEVEAFLLDLNRRARTHAQADLAELKSFASARDGVTDFAPWDLLYYAEKLKERKLGFSEEELRPYFQAPQVIAGMFSLVERLYGVRIREVRDVPTWHPDVTTYALTRGEGADDSAIGLFYLDPYAREDKRGGAWMDECVGRRRTLRTLQYPVAYLTCNFAPPLEGQPALLTHDETLTLFHEFGHGLHHLLTRVDEAAVSGIRGVEWDAVELPSQFMENWCYDERTLAGFARHHGTGVALPRPLLEKLKASRSFHAALATVRQLEFALFDLRLYRDYRPPPRTLSREGAGSGDGQAQSPFRLLDVLSQVRREVSVLPPPEWNRMPSSFGHIFGGGYAAGYYSYKWAEVLSADAFAAFEESDFAPETGQRFRDTVLAQGGSAEAMDLFVKFRGRRPNVEALLRQNGLAT
jgi:oligopeptidase A